MKVAFYAPLKPPDHPVPSGDRQLAQALLQALRAGGHDTFVASRFRSFDGAATRRGRRACAGWAIGWRSALVDRYRHAIAAPPDVWFTYHLYHKAPDWLGPAVSRALDIPYVVAEASVAAKQRDGPWAIGVRRIGRGDRGCRRDDLRSIRSTVAGIRRVRGAASADECVPPFLDLAAFTGADGTRRCRRAPIAARACG